MNETLEALKIFLQDNDTLISTLGAAAWCPAVVELFFKAKEKIEILNRKIEMSVLDSYIFEEERLDVNILVLAVNIHIPDKSFFCQNIEVEITYCDNSTFITEIIGRKMLYETSPYTNKIVIPNPYNFHLHREILCDKDNIRIIALPLVNMKTRSVGNIKKITFILKSNEATKKVTISGYDMRSCNGSNFLNEIIELNRNNIIRY